MNCQRVVVADRLPSEWCGRPHGVHRHRFAGVVKPTNNTVVFYNSVMFTQGSSREAADKRKGGRMSDPNTISDANHLVNDAITSIQNGDTEAANQQFEQAAQIYEQNGASDDAQDARDLITPA